MKTKRNPKAGNYTVVLTDEEALRVREILNNPKGSVGGFAASLVRLFLPFDPGQIYRIRKSLSEMRDHPNDANVHEIIRREHAFGAK